MDAPLWLLVVVPAIQLLVLISGIVGIVWRAGRLTQTLEDLGQSQAELAERVGAIEDKQTVNVSEIARVKGHLGLNGIPAQ